MTLTVLGMGIVGLLLSAFFSGSETGFYRVSRTRLVLDALGGDLISRGLLWLSNRPSLFVATTLVGNNLANYLLSMAIVIGAGLLLGGGAVAELIAPLVLAPVLFVYGELLPKNLFLQAPNRLLRMGGPLFFVFTVLFLPVSLLLWGFNLFFAKLVSKSPDRIKLTLARRELRGVLQEGHEVGILHSSQQSLARGIFARALQSVGKLAVPLRGTPRARTNMRRQDILDMAKRYQLAEVVVEDADTGRLAGYVRVIELGLATDDESVPLRGLPTFAADETSIVAITQLQSTGHSMAEVVDEDGKTLGLLSVATLRSPFFHGT